MKKKIGILTLPLSRNFGGILQAYALQHYLKTLGGDVYIIDRQLNRGVLYGFKLFVKKIFFKEKYIQILEKNAIAKCPEYFIKKYLTPKTKVIRSEKILKRTINHLNLDTIIVGSDQVWRINYLGDLCYNFFLDFINNPKIKKLSYAASFGVDEWSQDVSTTSKISKLLSSFDKISVREDSGVEILKDALNIETATHNIDPTLLLNPEQYIELADKEKEPDHKGQILVYMLDITSDKEKAIKKVERTLNGDRFLVNAKSSKKEAALSDRLYPSVTSWLRGFQNAKYVVADSFHGCIFALLFNKPFIAYGNVERGLTRFTSLLKLFKLEDRLILNSDDLNESIINKPINWGEVNEIIRKERLKTREFFDEL